MATATKPIRKSAAKAPITGNLVIDRLHLEGTITVVEAATYFSEVSGRTVTKFAVLNWMNRGLPRGPRGSARVILEHFKVGRTHLTSRQACVRYLSGC